MFKKEPVCKPQSNLKNSDRKKLLQQIGNTNYNNVGGELNTFQQGNFENHDGSIHGVLYTIVNTTNVDGKELSGKKQTLPIWFQVSKSNNKAQQKLGSLTQATLIPTVYSLWFNPQLLPVVITNDFVLDEKIIGNGANLMKRGCYSPTDDINEYQKNRPLESRAKSIIVGIASFKAPHLVKAVGVLEQKKDTSITGKSASGSKQGDEEEEESGVAVTVLHYLGDKICEHFKVNLQPSEELLRSEEEIMKEIESATTDTASTTEIPTMENEGSDKSQEPQLSVEEVDEILTRAMYYTLTNDEALVLPISSSNFVSNHINVNLPKNITPAMVNVKKSSYKKTNKLLKVWEKEGYMKLKSKGGDYVITHVAKKEEKVELKTFISYKPRGHNAGGNTTQNAGINGGNNNGDGNKHISSKILYKPSGPQAKELFKNNNENLTYLNQQQVREKVEKYFKESSGSTANGNLVDKKDPSKIICNDTLWLLMGKKLNDTTTSRVLPRNQIVSSILQSSTQLLKYYQIYSTEGKPILKEPARLSNKESTIPTIKITTEMKMKRKIITKIENTELYGIDLEELATKLKTKCSAATTVDDDKREVSIQGPHEAIVLNVLKNDYKIQATSPQYVSCENKLKNKKKSSTTPSSK